MLLINFLAHKQQHQNLTTVENFTRNHFEISIQSLANQNDFSFKNIHISRLSLLFIFLVVVIDINIIVHYSN